MKDQQQSAVTKSPLIFHVTKMMFFGNSLFHLANELSYHSVSLRGKLHKSPTGSKEFRVDNGSLIHSLEMVEQCTADIMSILTLLLCSDPPNLRKRPNRLISSTDTRNADGHLPANEPARLELVTEREREVMRLLVSNESNKQVAYNLGISVRTVEIHRRRIMEKLGLHSFGELVRIAIRNGIIEA